MFKTNRILKFSLLFSQFCLFAQDNIQTQSEQVFPVEDYRASLTKMLFMTVFLIGFLILTVWLLKKFLTARMNTTSIGKAIQIIESRSISPKSMLYLVEVEGERFLISESQVQIQKIEKLKINIQSSE